MTGMSKNFFYCNKIEEAIDEMEFHAIAKTLKGKGSEVEQKLAMQTIALKICHLNDQSFHPDNERINAFNEGVRYVGRILLKIDQVEADYFQQLKAIKNQVQKYKDNKFKHSPHNPVNNQQ